MDLLGILLLFICVIIGTDSTDYCTIKSCSGHTMCNFPKPGPGPDCQGYTKGDLNQEEKNAILSEHNLLRSKVATGKESQFPYEAANMKQMVWDEELAQIAQRLADQCKFQHDKCRNSERFYVGQNIASWSTSGGEVDLIKYMKQMVNNWYSEVKFTEQRQITKFDNQGKGGVIGHFTQLVWAATGKVGCGFTQTKDSKWTKLTLMCNYGPGGNMFGSSMYTPGSPCSKCPSGTTCSSEFPGLCKE